MTTTNYRWIALSAVIGLGFTTYQDGGLIVWALSSGELALIAVAVGILLGTASISALVVTAVFLARRSSARWRRAAPWSVRH